ncbi:MAG TPA: c-type cytochrome [Pyrinomonadaceae bacterium]|nr:c-type cytochrome [Pyrinomonadaceae bacterium]
MKLNILRLLVITLACASAFVVIADVRAEKHSALNESFTAPMPPGMQTPAPTAPQEKTIEQVQKNIKVLTGLPQSQLIPVMNYFAASMGRRCNFCHVNKNGQWDYASDEKQEKNTAREMIKMVLGVNKNTFKGNTEVSCYTCHRGRNQPQSIPTLPLPLPSPPPANSAGTGRPAGAGGPGAAAQASPSPTPAMPSADDIFNKYIAAIGGQAAIDKLTSRTEKGTIVQANGNTFQFELQQAAPDKFYFMVTTPQGAFERGFNGQVGWERNERGVRDITGYELANFKAGNALFSLIKLKEQYSRAPRVRRDKLNDRDVYVIDGTGTDGKRLRFFFDAESGLLLRRITWTPTVVGLIPEQVDLEDYREVAGVKFPFTARSSTIEAGNPVSTRTFAEIKLNAPVDDSKFNMPPKPATP